MRSLLTASVLTCTTLLTAALLLLPSTDAHRGCVHNKVVQKRPHRVPQPLGGRRSSGWDPIRIEFDTSGIDAAVPSDTKAYIEELVAECKTWLQAALKVHRLQGNLVLTAQGDGQTGCGPDQPSIPSKYTATGGGGSRSRHICAVAALLGKLRRWQYAGVCLALPPGLPDRPPHRWLHPNVPPAPREEDHQEPTR